MLTESELLMVGHDRNTGVKAVVAVDDTTLGPGLGGLRWMCYPSEDAAIREAQRLAAGMTLKHAVAGLPFGGAKSVLFEARIDDRVAIMQAFARLVAPLNGLYIPGVDMGTGVEDLAVIGSSVEVSCDKADPSPATALGVYHAIRAAVRAVFDSDLSGRTVMVQGAGHVGAALASLLSTDGAKVSLADIDRAKAKATAVTVGADVVSAAEALSTPSDVFAPCAGASVIDATNVSSLRARIIAGAANDVLSSRDCAQALKANGIIYVPDFVSNAGGVIHIYSERAGWNVRRLTQELSAIGTRVTQLLHRAESEDITPLQAAEDLASQRIGRRLRLPS
jgi:leucine dehydrogenase